MDYVIVNDFEDIFKHDGKPSEPWRAYLLAFMVIFTHKKSESKILSIRKYPDAHHITKIGEVLIRKWKIQLLSVLMLCESKLGEKIINPLNFSIFW